MNEGWVKTYRSLTDHWVWQDKPFSKGQAWMDLLLMVNHCEKKVLIVDQDRTWSDSHIHPKIK